MDTIRCSANRLVLWLPPRRPAMATSHPRALPAAFPARPVQLLALWGETRARRQLDGESFEATFEGKTDRGGHYYAQDHDHR